MTQTIEYIKGDATQPASSGNKIIVHVCNDIGGWGRGFVMALSARWPQPEQQYRKWFQSNENFALGEVQLVQVEEDIWVANMIGQRDVKPDKSGNPPVRYEAIAKALSKVADFATEKNASVHMPRIGCGLAGGTWDQMEPVIINELINRRIPVTVYDL
jgi:O-acetyl-ADP-ribose deacetylase (regulator of RNase III)